MDVLVGLMIPFIGTTLGAAGVFFLKKEIGPFVQKALLGFASGVMVAASVWSLLIPAMDMSSHLGKFAFAPAAVGFLTGVVFLLAMDRVIPHLHLGNAQPEGPKSRLQRTTLLMLAVTLHNFPEGAAAGAAYAGVLSGSGQISMAGALALSIGIAIQNFPEGIIISFPLRSAGAGRLKAFTAGMLSGIVEPAGAALAILLASQISGVLPYLLAFAAGAMIYVVVEELIPDANMDATRNTATIQDAVRFSVMMALDVALG